MVGGLSMSESNSHPTALAIARSVEEQLRTPKGAMCVVRQNVLVKAISEMTPSLAPLRASLRRRASMQFYTSVSGVWDSARRGELCLSVRVNGAACGTVEIRRKGPVIIDRIFTPTDTSAFSGCRYAPPAIRPWEDPEVARFIARAAEVKPPRPEASVEASFLSMLLRRGERPSELRLEQPVCLAGCPLQIPLPISASRKNMIPSESGHLDVLTRLGRGGKGLRLYELKRPGAPVARALDQAVTYAGALRVLLTQEWDALPWWQLIGFSSIPRRTPGIQAVTLVQDSRRNRETMAAAMARLSREPAPGITLGTFYYPDPPRPFRVLN
jgi:hypothetical protein